MLQLLHFFFSFSSSISLNMHWWLQSLTNSCMWHLKALLSRQYSTFSSSAYSTYAAGWLVVGWLVFNGTFSTSRLYCAISVWNIYCVGPGENIATQTNKTKIGTHEHFLHLGLCGDNLLTTEYLSSQSVVKLCGNTGERRSPSFFGGGTPFP